MRTVHERTTKAGERRWFVQFVHEGKHRSRTFDSRIQAAAFARDLDDLGVTETLRRAEQTEETTLDQWAGRYISMLTNITDGTRLAYTRLYAHVWQPRLGSRALSRITHESVAQAVNDYAATTVSRGGKQVPVADKTIANAHGLLAGMMREAVAEGLISRDPCARIKLPRRTEHEATEARYLTHAEFGRLIAAIEKHYRPLIIFLAGTGCRYGEAAALERRDVDLDAATVRIVRAEKADPSRSLKAVGPTKTPKSRRTIVLPPEVVETLRPLMDGAPDGRLFTSARGMPLRHRRVWQEIWLPACKEAGLEPRPRLHDLRHSHVAWLIAAGVPLAIIQARLGHESITTTIGTYGHLLPETQQAAARAASLALRAVALPAIES